MSTCHLDSSQLTVAPGGCAQTCCAAALAGRAAAAARSPGFGLIELIVALTILSIGLLGLTGVAAVAHRSLISAGALEEAAAAASTVIDSLMAVADPVAGERRMGRAVARWTVSADSSVMRLDITVSVTDGARAQRLNFHAVHRPE